MRHICNFNPANVQELVQKELRALQDQISHSQAVLAKLVSIRLIKGALIMPALLLKPYKLCLTFLFIFH